MRFELLKNTDGGTYLKRKGTDQMEAIEYTPPALTVNEVLGNHIDDLQWRSQQDGGGEAGLDCVNQGTAGTPCFETEQELDQYLTEVAGLIKC